MLFHVRAIVAEVGQPAISFHAVLVVVGLLNFRPGSLSLLRSTIAFSLLPWFVIPALALYTAPSVMCVCVHIYIYIYMHVQELTHPIYFNQVLG